MDLRGQDHKRIVMPSSFVYNPPIREPTSNKVSSPSIFATVGGGGGGGGGGRRDGSSGNGAAVLSSSHAFEHLHIHPQHSPPQPQPPQRVPDPDSEPEPDPDPALLPVSVALDVVGATSTPIVGGGGSNPRTPSARNEAASVRYRECLKNHAASTGGHVVDGCGEFMPGGEEGTPEALKCAACECHRNFHRKEADGEPHSGANYYYYNTSNKANGSRSRLLSPTALPPPPALPQPIQQQKFPIGLATSPPSGLMHTPMMMAFGGGGSAATDSSSEEHHMFHPNAGSGLPQHPPHYSSSSKKRFRTKFTKEQKDKMLEFAERVGWRMQKQDEPEIQQFCAEVGVKRQVLKVWMHNNKHTMKKKEL